MKKRIKTDLDARIKLAYPSDEREITVRDADMEQNREFNLMLPTVRKKSLNRSMSIERIDEGVYGVCGDREENIPWAASRSCHSHPAPAHAARSRRRPGIAEAEGLRWPLGRSRFKPQLFDARGQRTKHKIAHACLTRSSTRSGVLML